jgi:hypothetical protein
MSLPQRKKNLLPSLDSIDKNENNIENLTDNNDLEEFSLIETEMLTDDDFIEENNIEKIKEKEEDAILPNKIEDRSKLQDDESKKESKKINFNFNIEKIKEFKKIKIPKFNNINYNNLLSFKKLSYKTIITIIVIIIIGLFIISKLLFGKAESQNNNLSELSYKFKNEEYQGIVFTVKSNQETKINLQRIYKETNGNLVLCETGEKDIEKDVEQEVFLTCLNNTEDILDTSKKLIKDNIMEIK